MTKHVIKNFDALATTPLRKDALSIVEAGLFAIDTEKILRSQIAVEGAVLRIRDNVFNLSEYENVYLIGFGKASGKAALTLEDIFKGHLKDGVVVGISEADCRVVQTCVGTHPTPSEVNVRAAEKIIELASKATEKDLVLVMVSGGGSSLLCSSVSECEQGIRLYEAFKKVGGTIQELNTVRKHLSSLKGGGLAEILYPARVIGIIFSDVPGGTAEMVASGPTYLDKTNVKDAQAIIDRYQLGDFVLNETPKDVTYFDRVHNEVLVSNDVALQAMAEKAESLGYHSDILCNDLYEPQAQAVKTIQEHARAETAVVAGGETLVVVDEHSTGKGGRNDTLVLHMAPYVQDGQVFISAASDGHDNSEMAGALMDTEMAKKIKEQGFDTQEHIEHTNVFPVFETVKGHLHTGNLESNVSDLMLMLQEKHD